MKAKSIFTFVLGLLLVAFTPLVAAAASLDVTPYIGPAGIFQTVAAAGLGLGVVLSGKAVLGEKTKLFKLDSEADDFDETMHEYVEAKQEETAIPLRAENEALSKELTEAKTMLAEEICRVKKLQASDEEEFDAETEMAYLTGLPMERLKLEYKRLPKPETLAAPEGRTHGEEPAVVDPEDPYAQLTA